MSTKYIYWLKTKISKFVNFEKVFLHLSGEIIQKLRTIEANHMNDIIFYTKSKSVNINSVFLLTKLVYLL